MAPNATTRPIKTYSSVSWPDSSLSRFLSMLNIGFLPFFFLLCLAITERKMHDWHVLAGEMYLYCIWVAVNNSRKKIVPFPYWP